MRRLFAAIYVAACLCSPLLGQNPQASHTAVQAQVQEAKVGWLATVLPVLTLVLGYGLKYVADWVQEQRTIQREREARQDARRDQNRERRVTFQRETLLALQEAMLEVASTTVTVYFTYLRAHRLEGMEWRRILLPPELDEKSRNAMQRTAMLRVRVRDDEVRSVANNVTAISSRLTSSDSKEAGERIVFEMLPAVEAFNKRIGEVLRTLDNEEDENYLCSN